MMKKYNEFKINESWRKIKSYLRYPGATLDWIFSKVLNYVPLLNYRYDEISAEIDNGKNMGIPREIKEDIKKISLSDIKSSKMKRSLIQSGLLKSWNLYYVKTFGSDHKGNSYNNDRDMIYLSKDELKKGDITIKDRVNDHLFFKDEERGEYNKDELPEVFVLVALKTSDHDDIRKERDDAYKLKEYEEFSKLLDIAIKKSEHEYPFGTLKPIPSMYYTYSIHNNNKILLHELVKFNQLKLVQKYLDNCKNDKDRIELINMYIDVHGYRVDNRRYNDIMSFDLTKTKEMRNILIKWLSKKHKLEYVKKNKPDLTLDTLRKINQ